MLHFSRNIASAKVQIIFNMAKKNTFLYSIDMPNALFLNIYEYKARWHLVMSPSMSTYRTKQKY